MVVIYLIFAGFDHVQTTEKSRSMFANQQTGAHWGQHLAEDRGPWAEEGGPPFRESRLEPVERRAPTYQEELEQQVTSSTHLYLLGYSTKIHQMQLILLIDNVSGLKEQVHQNVD